MSDCQRLQTDASAAAIYRRYITLVRRQARRILGDTAQAEDVAQDVFIKFLEYRRRGAVEDHTAAFLFRMATNAALGALRRRRPVVEQDALGAAAAAPNDATTILRDLLRRCSEREAEVASCYYLGEMKQEEIAEALGMSRHQVRRRLESFVEKAGMALRSAS